MKAERYHDVEGAFALEVPAGWSAGRDEEGGLLLGKSDGAGLLHLIAFVRELEEAIDPGEELFAFLEDQDIELEEDEVEDLDLPGGGELALCEYIAEDEDEEAYWMVGVATVPGRLVFAHYSCPAAEAESESEAVRGILSSLCLTASGG